jgi:N-acetylmuramoyl-L-alanine amidase
MSVPAKQIGWSQEANLLWEIAKQLDAILKACGSV